MTSLKSALLECTYHDLAEKARLLGHLPSMAENASHFRYEWKPSDKPGQVPVLRDFIYGTLSMTTAKAVWILAKGGDIRNRCIDYVARGEVVYRCAYCGVGTVQAEIGSRCPMAGCGAVVNEVHDTQEGKEMS